MKEEENKGNIIIYQTEGGFTRIEVRLQEETLWLSQRQLAELYQTSKSNINEYIRHIFEEGELVENSVVRNFRITAADGKDYKFNDSDRGLLSQNILSQLRNRETISLLLKLDCS